MNNDHFTGNVASYPRQPQEGLPEPSLGRRPVKVLLAAVGVLAAVAAVVGVGFGVLYAFNPMGDEWVCSDGEAPAGKPGHYNQCFEEDSPLPQGYEWDPFGNRPMPYNCDKDGWVLIERTVSRKNGSDTVQDCVREGTELPGRWHTADEG
jgi:hypothetical protein